MTVDPEMEMNGLLVVLVTVPPLLTKTTPTPLVMVSVAPPVMLRSGPAKLTLAGEATSPDELALNTSKTAPLAIEPLMTFVPPSVTVPPVRLMSGEVVVLLRLERRT